MGRSIFSSIIRATRLVNREVPRLGDAEVRELVQRFIDRNSGFLAAVHEEGSPLYLLDTTDLVTKARRFRDTFREVLPDARIYYALKSNSHPVIAGRLVAEGFGLDVSSGVELRIALDCGSRDIVFSGPGKRPDELKMAVDHVDRVTVLADSKNELDKLEERAAAAGKPIRSGLRIAVDDTGIWRKFGVPLRDLPAVLVQARDYQYVNLTGLQFHLSWNLDPGAQVSFIEKLCRVLQQVADEQLEQLTFLDIGGGFWPERGEWLQPAATAQGMMAGDEAVGEAGDGVRFKRPAAPLSQFASRIASALRQNLPPNWNPTICMEPGRWLCDDAMHIVLTVADKKADDLVITDGGTNAVGWDRFETDFYPVINLCRPALDEHRCLVAGSLCTPHDIWGYTYFGESISEGDILLIPCQGAYTYSLRQEFIKPLPKCVDLADFA